MNSKIIFKQTFLFAFILSIGATTAFGQGIFGRIKEKVKTETDKQKNSIPKANNPLNTSGFKWARIETRVSWQDRAQTKYETRVYYSNVSPYQTGDAKMVENLAKYFEKGIVAPLK